VISALHVIDIRISVALGPVTLATRDPKATALPLPLLVIFDSKVTVRC
jgi:hypothetical protein